MIKSNSFEKLKYRDALLQSSSRRREKYMKCNFSKDFLQNLAAKETLYYVSDLHTPNMRLAVYLSGVKTFLLCRKVKQQYQRIKIGRLADLTIAQARKRANELNAMIALGGNPQAEKQAERNETTFGELYDFYYSQHAFQFTKRPVDNKKTMEINFLAKYGKTKVSEITTEGMRQFHTKLAEKSSPGNANRVIAIISATFNFCIKNSYYEGNNPCAHVKKYKTYSRDRFLSRRELEMFFDAVKKEEPLFEHFFLMLLYTGARKSNVLSMKWGDIDLQLKQWRISETETKNKDVNIVYLPEQAINILNIRPFRDEQAAKHSPYVFPSVGKKGYLNDPKKAFERIRERMEIDNFRMHDLRRTLGSYMAIGGSSLPIIGKALNHKSQVSTAIYARLSQDPVIDAVNQAVNLIENKGVLSSFKENVQLINHEISSVHFSCFL